MGTYKDKYKEYIISSKWFQLRRKVFDLQGKECKRCKSKKKIHVHHKTYERLGEENIETDLVVFCKKCHDIYHTIYKHTSIETTDLFIEDKTLSSVSVRKRKRIERKEKRQQKVSKKELKKAIKYVASVNKGIVSRVRLHDPKVKTSIELLSIV